MLNEHPMVGIFATPLQADRAVVALLNANFDVQAISVIGVDAKSTTSVPGFQAWIDSVANRTAFFGHALGTPTQGILLIPEVGPALAIGHLAETLGDLFVDTINHSTSTVAERLIASLMQLSISRQKALRIEAEIAAGKFVVIVECPLEEADRAEQVLQQFEQSICLDPVLIRCQKC